MATATITVSNGTGENDMWFSLFIEALTWVPEVVAGAAVISAATPTKRDDKFLSRLVRFIDRIGFNFGHAKNVPVD